MLGEGHDLCEVMGIGTFVACFKLSFRLRQPHPWTIFVGNFPQLAQLLFQRAHSTISVIIGADFVVKYEWAGKTVVIDKRTIMRMLLKTAGKPEDDGQLCHLVDE